MTQLTQWHSSKTKPVRVGLYQTISDNGVVRWRYWNGKYWGWGYTNKKWAISWRNFTGGTQTEMWRGLSSVPQQKLEGA